MSGPPMDLLGTTTKTLSVTDALSYLDSVKQQFSEKPDVYNHFLDIMKDFKSQAIDTPGVIQRVSGLFHGNPALIQGFNTFLPHGYRIDISADPRENMITVTTPMGTSTQSTDSFSLFAMPRAGDPPTPASIDPNSAAPSTNAAASFLGNLNPNTNPVENKPQFNLAIHFLNKVKARYNDDTSVYHQFLGILQTYQKEQQQSHDNNNLQSQVYIQVRTLFGDTPDLLAEFKDFLPSLMGDMPSAPQSKGNNWQENDARGQDKSKKSTPVAPPPKRKKRPAEKDPTPVPPAPPLKSVPSRSKKAKLTHRAESPEFSPYMESPQHTNAHANSHSYSHQAMPPPREAHRPYELYNAHPASQAFASGEDMILFFDRAKKALESQDMYDDFLRLLNLFSKDIVDMKTLIERVVVFFDSDSELMVQFKEILGFDDRQGIERGPPGSIRTAPPEALAAMPADDGQGPSYRKLPQSEVGLACSGRDELGRSVLNDGWVSHPTWASEDAGFVAHKKNAFEEALHKSEEERHEYHVQIEATTRTIAILEPLNARLDEMVPEERAAFRLKSTLGGPSPSIYHRIIRKVYGRDAGTEVIQALQDCPSTAVPVVLARLKQKDEEWRRAQREWTRTWREVDAKNFYKSLDHQGISFKASDKKNITAKHFVADIQSIKSEQIQVQEDVASSSSSSSTSPPLASQPVGHQLEYSFSDMGVVYDSLKLVYTFLDHSHAQYSPPERRHVEQFLREFVPLLFMANVPEFDTSCGFAEGSIHQDEQADGGGKGKRAKHVGRCRSSGPSSAAGSEAGEDTETNAAAAAERAAHDPEEDIWAQEAPPPTPRESTQKPFFANTTFYTLFRLLQMIYSRLAVFKEIGAQLASKKHDNLLANPIAVELGLHDSNGPTALLAQAYETYAARVASRQREPEEDANVIYIYLLDALEKLFDNELDQGTFEEHMRWFFGNKAYHVFTLDKVITALVKQVQVIIGDVKCRELWDMLETARGQTLVTQQDVIRFRREVEELFGTDDPLYKIVWTTESKTMRVHLIEHADASVDEDTTPYGRWREYVDSFVLKHPTEWLPPSLVESMRPPVFLRRCLLPADKASRLVNIRPTIRIKPGKFKLVYQAGMEDFLFREVYELDPGGKEALRSASRRSRSSWLEL